MYHKLILAVALSTASPAMAEREAEWEKLCRALGVVAEGTASLRRLGASLDLATTFATSKVTNQEASLTIKSAVRAVYAMPEEMEPGEVGSEITALCRNTK